MEEKYNMEKPASLDYQALATGLRNQVYAGNLMKDVAGRDPLANPVSYDEALTAMRKTLMEFSAKYGQKLPTDKQEYGTWTAVVDVLKKGYGTVVSNYQDALSKVNQLKSDLGTEGKLDSAVGEMDFTFQRQCVGFS